MKEKNTQKTYLIISLISVVLSVAFMVVNYLAFPSFLVHPVLNSVALLFFVLSLTSLTAAVKEKAPIYFLLGGVLLSLVILYVLLALFIELWWIAVVCTIAVLVVVMLLSYIIVGNKTEEIALNKSKDYKDYLQRKEEKEKAEESKEKQELPEIKSFKE